jgi:nitronate monooxygenase
VRDAEHASRVREVLGQWGPPVPPEAGEATPVDFGRQCEAMLAVACADALAELEPDATMPTRAFSGRLGRSITTEYARAAAAPDSPPPAPYPVQRGLTAPMRDAAARAGDAQRMQTLSRAGRGAGPPEPAGDIVLSLWQDAQALLP